MTSARCPACGAAVANGAPWCTLCYTELRPKPVEQPNEQPAAVVTPPPAARVEGSGATPPPVPGPAALDLLDPVLDAPVSTQADVVTGPATWPCHACDATVPLSEPACPRCGTAFLSGAEPALSVSLPGVGDARNLTPAGRFAVMAVGVGVVATVLFVLLVVIGQLL